MDSYRYSYHVGGILLLGLCVFLWHAHGLPLDKSQEPEKV